MSGTVKFKVSVIDFENQFSKFGFLEIQNAKSHPHLLD